ncbi:crotonase/enoyl-CoA hydratase family protein [uncultured Pseudoteredinibacter sp.]|uniref:crotonase/enoyl-CoA hydratase family protein n=1 Tax=uncultured Pseudoteredinibacter sp. TaxID=1641701 RepID=UPI00262A751A|nr:crotonase/enoyl-CoA hydratase family protein [uncultured Pseudoteredinibacter sp.]
MLGHIPIMYIAIMGAAMNYQAIIYDIKDNILTITLNRPDELNAFTIEMAEELIDAFDRASKDDEVRAVVVTGAGRGFCAGMKLNSDGNAFGLDEELEPSLEDIQDLDKVEPGIRDSGGTVTLAIYNCTKPVIAAINGPAIGIGATMTCAMDIRLASSKAKVGFVFTKLGITPEACSAWFLPKIVGISQALEWVYTAEIFDAEEAKSGGFVKSIHEPDDLLAAAYKIARRIADNTSPVAIALSRQMMYRLSAADHPAAAHKVDSLAIFYQSLVDGKEGINAFWEKRPAKFSAKVSTDMPDFFPWQADN